MFRFGKVGIWKKAISIAWSRIETAFQRSSPMKHLVNVQVLKIFRPIGDVTAAFKSIKGRFQKWTPITDIEGLL